MFLKIRTNLAQIPNLTPEGSRQGGVGQIRGGTTAKPAKRGPTLTHRRRHLPFQVSPLSPPKLSNAPFLPSFTSLRSLPSPLFRV